MDASHVKNEHEKGFASLSEFVLQHMHDLGVNPQTTLADKCDSHNLINSNTLVVLNKTDLLTTDELEEIPGTESNCCMISCVNEDGMDNFLDVLTTNVKDL